MIEEKYLQEFDLYKVLGPKDRGVLASCLTMRKYEPKQTIFRAGDTADACYILLAGSARLYLESIEVPGKYKQLDEYTRGELFGVFSLIDRGKRFYSLRSGERGLILAEFKFSDLSQILHSDTPFAYRLLDAISAKIAQRVASSGTYAAKLQSLADGHQSQSVQ
jgi:CRP-like cAMP-binding protein